MTNTSWITEILDTFTCLNNDLQNYNLTLLQVLAKKKRICCQTTFTTNSKEQDKVYSSFHLECLKLCSNNDAMYISSLHVHTYTWEDANSSWAVRFQAQVVQAKFAILPNMPNVQRGRQRKRMMPLKPWQRSTFSIDKCLKCLFLDLLFSKEEIYIIFLLPSISYITICRFRH